jgi:Flp pilus assembly protein TadG
MKQLLSQTGAALVEFAIVVPLLLSIVAATADFGFLFRAYEVTSNAAREGARLAAIPPNEQNGYATVLALVDAYLNNSGILNPPCPTCAVPVHTVTVTSEPIAVGALTANGVRVTVTYNYAFLFLGPAVALMNQTFRQTLTIQSTALMRVQIAGVRP